MLHYASFPHTENYAENYASIIRKAYKFCPHAQFLHCPLNRQVAALQPGKCDESLHQATHNEDFLNPLNADSND